jgi:hypothetical protein
VVVVAKWDWDKLKQDYILGDYKTLKEFSEKTGVEYIYLRRKGSKWNDEKLTLNAQKVNKVINIVNNKKIQKESKEIVDTLNLYNKALEYASKILDNEMQTSINGFGIEFTTKQINSSKLKTIVDILEKGQKGRRLEQGYMTAYELKKIEIEEKKLEIQKEMLEIARAKSGMFEDEEDTYKMVEIPSIDYSEYDKEQQRLIEEYIKKEDNKNENR